MRLRHVKGIEEKLSPYARGIQIPDLLELSLVVIHALIGNPDGIGYRPALVDHGISVGADIFRLVHRGLHRSQVLFDGLFSAPRVEDHELITAYTVDSRIASAVAP